MQVVLPPDLEEYVHSKIQSGDYRSAEEMVGDALARLRAEEIDPSELRRLVAEGQASADRGELIKAEDVFKEIQQESRRRRGLPE
jgi:putative addiction module CopG family antidote